MPRLVIITGPIAAGKSTVAKALADRMVSAGSTVAIAGVHEVAAMVHGLGAAQSGLWFAAHEAHGALVGQWMRSSVGYVIVEGGICSREEQAALSRHLPPDTSALWVVIDAPVAVTLSRAQLDPSRGLSREPGFHNHAHHRFRRLLPLIPADLSFDSSERTAAEMATAVHAEAISRWSE